jgi:NAD(P) transhydrogenase subunit alpha
VPTTTAATVGVLKERGGHERRVALDPAAAQALIKRGYRVLVETGAGESASFRDAAYVASGAAVASRKEVVARANIVAVVRPPDAALVTALRADQVILGLLDPLNNLDTVAALAAKRVIMIAFELLPRTVTRAQSMDAMSSQASAAGYRAALVAADAFGRYLPMMITASGTATPAKVIVIGTGVAGLQTIATFRRLGAVVTGYDVRSASRPEVESLGATFLTSSVAEGAGTGGYARALTPAERAIQQDELAAALVGFDIIVTTAKVPGHAPPLIVSADTIYSLRAGTVCVDLGSSELGGNVAGSVVDTTTVTPHGVTIIGAGDLASDLPTSASQMYGRNVVAVLASLLPGGTLAVDPDDEVHSNIVVTRDGEVVSPAVRSALKLEPLAPAAPTTEVLTS